MQQIFWPPTQAGHFLMQLSWCTVKAQVRDVLPKRRCLPKRRFLKSVHEFDRCGSAVVRWRCLSWRRWSCSTCSASASATRAAAAATAGSSRRSSSKRRPTPRSSSSSSATGQSHVLLSRVITSKWFRLGCLLRCRVPELAFFDSVYLCLLWIRWLDEDEDDGLLEREFELTRTEPEGLICNFIQR